MNLLSFVLLWQILLVSAIVDNRHIGPDDLLAVIPTSLDRWDIDDMSNPYSYVGYGEEEEDS